MGKEGVSRRDYLKVVGGTVGGLVVGGAIGYLAKPSEAVEKTVTQTQTETKTVTATAPAVTTTPAKKIHLDFTVWNYDVEKVKDNASKFMQKYPNIELSTYDFNWPDFPTTMVKRFTVGTPTDVTYDGEDWLAQWASAGWIVPLQDIWDQYQTEHPWSYYVNDMVPYAKQSCTFEGKIYGLPYYSDMFTFIYNDKKLKDKGFAPPKDWDEVLQQCLAFKKDGIKYPFILSFEPKDVFAWCNVLSSAYGRGARLFDKDLNPVFNEAGSPFVEQLQWYVDGLYKDEIVNPEWSTMHETISSKNMSAGEGVFCGLAKYNAAAMNTPGSGPEAGNFRVGLMPGKTHEAYGFAKMYNLTKICVDRGSDAVQAAITFIEYFGGSGSPVLKRWAVENGLGFGFDSPWDDPDIASGTEQLYGAGAATTIREQAKLATAEAHPIWFGEWNDYVRKECLAKVFTKEITPQKCADLMADNWNSLKKA